jgi:hypothetical protein
MADAAFPPARILVALQCHVPLADASSRHLNTVTQTPSYVCRLRPSHLSLLQSWPQSRLRDEGVALFGLAAAPDGAVARDVVVKFFVPEQALPFHSFSQVHLDEYSCRYNCSYTSLNGGGSTWTWAQALLQVGATLLSINQCYTCSYELCWSLLGHVTCCRAPHCS